MRAAAGSARTAASSPTWPGPLAATMPNSAIRPHSWLITLVRCLTSSAQLVQPRRRLLGFALDRDKAHRRPAHRLADRRRVRGIVLVSAYVGLGIGRRDQAHVVADPGQLAHPVMRRGAGLHADQAGRQLGEPRQHRARRSARRTVTAPLASTPCTWNTVLARSRPIVLTMRHG